MERGLAARFERPVGEAEVNWVDAGHYAPVLTVQKRGVRNEPFVRVFIEIPTRLGHHSLTLVDLPEDLYESLPEEPEPSDDAERRRRVWGTFTQPF